MAQIFTIENLVYGGRGLARTEEGKVILLPYVLDGEVVEVQALEAKGNILTGVPSKIVTPNENRVTPPCPYFGECGGCQYQHIAYRHQVDVKRWIIQEQLQRLGDIKDVKVSETVISEVQYGYRNHVQFHLDSEGKIGFQRSLSNSVVQIVRCLLCEEPLNELLQSLNFDAESGLERVSIRNDDNGTPLVMLQGASLNPPEFEVDFPINVVYRSKAGEMGLSGDSFNVFEIRGKPFRVSAGSFFQTNRLIAEKMIENVLSNINWSPRPVLMDLYCGVGLFSRFLAENASRMIGIESSEDACNDFAVNLDEYENIELYLGKVEDVLPALDIRPDVIVLDPPRAGLHHLALKALVTCQPGQIIYISCDPSTLARDLKYLRAAGYQVESVTPFDMFPQTYHIESITVLHKS